MKRQHSVKAIIEAGTDEAGRGCLAGPVTAAAVILPPDFKNELLNDSKQLTEKQRNLLRPIIEKEAVAWAVAHVSPEEIDSMNILNASIEAMHRSIAQLDPQPHFIAVDGNPISSLSKHPSPLPSQRRRYLPEHRSRFGPRKNLPRRSYA